MPDIIHHAVLNLGKVAYKTPGRRDNRVTLELEIRDHSGSPELSICGSIWNRLNTDCVSCGQNIDTVRDLFKGSRRVKRIAEIWERWHLNTMNAGTPAQTAAINAHFRDGGIQYDYVAACDHLAGIGLLVDNGYRYGSAWLTEEIPPEVLTEIRTLFGSSVAAEA